MQLCVTRPQRFDNASTTLMYIDILPVYSSVHMYISIAKFPYDEETVSWFPQHCIGENLICNPLSHFQVLNSNYIPM